MANRYNLILSVLDARLLLGCCFLPRTTVAAWSFAYCRVKWGLGVTAAAWTFSVFLVRDTNRCSLGRLMSVCTSVQTDNVGGKVFLGLPPSLLTAAQCSAGGAIYPHGQVSITLHLPPLQVVISPCLYPWLRTPTNSQPFRQFIFLKSRCITETQSSTSVTFSPLVMLSSLAPSEPSSLCSLGYYDELSVYCVLLAEKTGLCSQA